MSLKTISEKIQDSHSAYILCLSLLFIFAFSVPLIFAFTVGGAIGRYSKDIQSSGTIIIEEQEKHEKDKVFPLSINITGPNSYLSVETSSAIEPASDKDFFLYIWLKLRRLPAEGERLILLSKFDERSASRRGYSLALSGEREAVRPEVYWRDENNNGTWFTFSELDASARTWTLFALSFRQGRYLGLHAATINSESDYPLKLPDIKLLGGYELPEIIIPTANSDLLVGAFGGGRFRGRMGPIGIFHTSSLTRKLDEILQHIVSDSRTLPDAIERREVGLWIIDGHEDKSSAANKVKFTKSRAIED